MRLVFVAGAAVWTAPGQAVVPARAEPAEVAAAEVLGPRLRGDMPTAALRRFQRTVARQAAAFPDAVVVEARGDAPVVALTFDDGPDALTEPLLEILAEREVRATFFVVGQRARRRPELVRAMRDAGHAVAGHGYRHDDLRELSARAAYERHVAATEEVLADILGEPAGYFRPPYGAVTDEQIERFAAEGVRTVLWSVDSGDWDPERDSAREIEAAVLQHAHPGAVILLHSGRHRKGTAKALPGIISALRERGYGFVTVPELLELPASD